MYVHWLWKLPFFVLAFAVILDYVATSPIDELSPSSELRDLNKIPIKTRIDAKTESSSFTHYDEDSIRLVVDLSDNQKLKYDVEILEPRDNKKETAELEERFRGPSIKVDTDNFVAEDIEVNSGKSGVNAAVGMEKANADEANKVAHNDDNDDDDNETEEVVNGDKDKHMLLTLVLVLVALFSITIYIALVLWRSYLERRYAERELLVNDDDDFYLPSSETMDRRW